MEEFDWKKLLKLRSAPKFPKESDYQTTEEYLRALKKYEAEMDAMDTQMNQFNQFAELATSDVPAPVQARNTTVGQYKQVDPTTMSFNTIDPMAEERRKRELEEMIRMGGLMGLSPNTSLQQRWSMYGR